MKDEATIAAMKGTRGVAGPDGCMLFEPGVEVRAADVSKRFGKAIWQSAWWAKVKPQLIIRTPADQAAIAKAQKGKRQRDEEMQRKALREKEAERAVEAPTGREERSSD